MVTMTTRMCPSILLTCMVIGLFATVHSLKLKPVKEAFEITTEVLIPCSSRCVVQSYRAVLESANRCVMSNTGVMMEVQQYLSDNKLLGNSTHIPTYQQIYDAMFSEGKSPLCRWYKQYGGCFQREFGQICGRGVMQALTGLITDFEMLVCSQNPNYVACVMHPSLVGNFGQPSQTTTSPYAICATNLANNFMNINYENYYEELIINDNGAKLFSTIRTFVNCIGDAVKTVGVDPPPRTGPTGCAVVGEDIKKYINDALDYFHFGQNGKDYVKCFTNRALHMDLKSCGTAFATDLETTFGDSVWARLNTTLFNGGYNTLQVPYSSLSTCFKTALNKNCGSETDSVALVDRVLHPLDHLFGVRSDEPAFCSGSDLNTPMTPVPPVTRLKPLKDAFEITTEVVIPCGSRCAVQSYRDVLSAANTCIMANTGIVMEVQKFLTDNNLENNPSYQQIYNAMFSEGSSPLCRWYRKYGGCFAREFGQICGLGIMEALTGLVEDFEMLICSSNPNYLSCVTHPSLVSDNSQYGRCAQNVMIAFQNIDYDHFYEELIINDGGRRLFTTLKTFGNCIGDAVKTVSVSPPTGCAVVGEDIKRYVNDALDYFYFGQGGKDYVKCFSSPALHMDLQSCGTTFATDLETTFGNSVWAELNATLFRGGYSVLSRPYSKLSGCLKMALDKNCRSQTDSVTLIDRCLHPLDLLFEVRTDPAPYCDGIRNTNSTQLTSVASPGLILSGLLMLLGILLQLH